MRDDFDGELPDIRATDEDRVGARSAEPRAAAPEPPLLRAVREPEPRRQRNGALWAVCLSLLIALIGLGYWSHQQQTRLQQQLVATQESFAQISEEAAGRLQDISGKVVATESSLSASEQARAQQLSQLEERVKQLAAALLAQETELQEQQQSSQERQQLLQQLQQAGEAQTQRLTTLDGLTSTLGEEQQRQQQGLAELKQQAQQATEARTALHNELAQADEQLKQLATLQQLAEQGIQLARQRGELQALREASTGPSVAQEMLVLRSDIDLRLSSMEDALRAVDSLRVQTNRTISTLQSSHYRKENSHDQKSPYVRSRSRRRHRHDFLRR